MTPAPMSTMPGMTGGQGTSGGPATGQGSASQGGMNHGSMQHGGMSQGGMSSGGMNHGAMGHGSMPGMAQAGAARPAAGMSCPMMQAGGGCGMMGGRQAAAPAGDESAPSLAFRAVNDKMHRDMNILFTGKVDADFARAMLAHHQGAVDMAKIAVAFGEDPEIRKLAGEIIRAQESEIATMKAWLAKNGEK
jgi:uncharacterized protein (DUF305 family)